MAFGVVDAEGNEETEAEGVASYFRREFERLEHVLPLEVSICDWVSEKQATA